MRLVVAGEHVIVGAPLVNDIGIILSIFAEFTS